jgi:hypothetical protein
MPSPAADRPLRLVVHVGPHKTGTTYLQTNFSLRAQALRAEGWLYPAIGERIAAAQHDLAERGREFLDGRGRAVRDFRSVLRRADADGLNVLLSSESFRRWRPAHFKALAEAAAPRALHLVYTLRDPLDALHSAWAQRVRGGATEGLPQWLERHFAAPPATSRLDPMAELGPLSARAGAACTILLYDRLRREERDLFTHFLQTVLGVGGVAAARQSANARWPIELTEFLRLLVISHGRPRGRGEHRPGVDPGFVLDHLFGRDEKQAIVAAVAAAGEARRTLDISRTTPRYGAIEARLIARVGALMSPPPEDGAIFPREPAHWTYYDEATLGRSPAVAALLADAARRMRPGNPALFAADLGKRALIGWRIVRKRFRI